MIRPLLLILTLAAVLFAATPALARKQKLPDPAPLKYGMAQADALKEIGDPIQWRVFYKVDTASTCEFAAQWKDEVGYIARFHAGKCIFIEKRATVTRDEVDDLLKMYKGAYGDTPEAAMDSSGKEIFARWVKPTREVSLSAMRLADGRYKLDFEEFDPVELGAARRAQEGELSSSKSTDPLTGAGRINPLGPSADTGKDATDSDDGPSPTDDAKDAAPASTGENAGGAATADKPADPPAADGSADKDAAGKGDADSSAGSGSSETKPKPPEKKPAAKPKPAKKREKQKDSGGNTDDW